MTIIPFLFLLWLPSSTFCQNVLKVSYFSSEEDCVNGKDGQTISMATSFIPTTDPARRVWTPSEGRFSKRAFFSALFEGSTFSQFRIRTRNGRRGTQVLINSTNRHCSKVRMKKSFWFSPSVEVDTKRYDFEHWLMYTLKSKAGSNTTSGGGSGGTDNGGGTPSAPPPNPIPTDSKPTNDAPINGAIVEFKMIGLVYPNVNVARGKTQMSDKDIENARVSFTKNFPAQVKAMSHGRVSVVTDFVVMGEDKVITSYEFADEMIGPTTAPGWEEAVYGKDWASLSEDQKQARIKSPPYDGVVAIHHHPADVGLLEKGSFVDGHHLGWISIGQQFRTPEAGLNDGYATSVVHEFLHTVIDTFYSREFSPQTSKVLPSLGGADPNWVHATLRFGWEENRGLFSQQTNEVVEKTIQGTDMAVDYSWNAWYYALLAGKVFARPGSEMAGKGLSGPYGLTDEVLKLGNIRNYWRSKS